jgi:hypothetical protein
MSDKPRFADWRDTLRLQAGPDYQSKVIEFKPRIAAKIIVRTTDNNAIYVDFKNKKRLANVA